MSAKLDISLKSMRYPGAGGKLIGPLSLSLAGSEFVALLGPSGAGKTTLLRIIAGLETRFAGEVVIDGQRVARPSRRIQILFQDNRLLPWMTASENVAFALPELGGTAAEQASAKMLDLFGLSARKGAWPSQLSGGEQSRVAIARALAPAPEILLLDEPFKNLDLPNRIAAAGQLRQVLTSTGTTTLMVSHDIEEALMLADRIIVLESGPLRIARTYRVEAPRLRTWADPKLRELSASIVQAIQGAS